MNLKAHTFYRPVPPAPLYVVPPLQIADITFNVWYRLSEELVKAGASLAERFKPYVQKLIGHLCTHCQLDEDTSPVRPRGLGQS